MKRLVLALFALCMVSAAVYAQGGGYWVIEKHTTYNFYYVRPAPQKVLPPGFFHLTALSREEQEPVTVNAVLCNTLEQVISVEKRRGFEGWPTFSALEYMRTAWGGQHVCLLV